MIRKASLVYTENSPAIMAHAAVGGKTEAEGPLGQCLDLSFEDSYVGMKSWEKAESELQRLALNTALRKAELKPEEIDVVFAGDLLNQCISSTFGLRELNIPFMGQFGACSTMAQTLIMASCAVDSGMAEKAAAVTSSHFCTAERQFRLPLEYGSQRTPNAQWTATASGSAIVGKDGKVKVKAFTVGRITDLGIKDAANMGAAMAPAAADTILRFLTDSGTTPEDYDCIYTGDLGYVGSELFCDLLLKNGVDVRDKHNDCGKMIYYREKQDVHSGGSGCGCSASVLCGHILNELESGRMKRIIFAATGALMSPTSSQQGESIPGICHAVELVAEN